MHVIVFHLAFISVSKKYQISFSITVNKLLSEETDLPFILHTTC